MQQADDRRERTRVCSIPDLLLVRDQSTLVAVVTCTDAAGLVHYVSQTNTWCSWIRTWTDGSEIEVDLEFKLVTCLECIAQEQRNASKS